jgi:hypothetical protein
MTPLPPNGYTRLVPVTLQCRPCFYWTHQLQLLSIPLQVPCQAGMLTGEVWLPLTWAVLALLLAVQEGRLHWVGSSTLR